MGLSQCAFVRLKNVNLIEKLLYFLAICLIYILIPHRPEGHDPKQYKILLIEHTNLKEIQWDYKRGQKSKKLNLNG